MGFEAAKCPVCGADIQVPTDRDVVKCMFCGKDIVVRQAMAAGAGASVANWMRLAIAAAEADNHEEAYGYFTRVLEVDSDNSEAWLGKGIAAGWSSNLRADRLSEMTAGIETALRHAGDGRKQIEDRAAAEVLSVVTAFFTMTVEHTREFIAVESSWSEHVQRCIATIDALSTVIALVNGTKTLYEAKLAIIDALLTGMEYQTNDSGGFEYWHVSDDLAVRLQQDRQETIASIKAIDPGFVADEVKPVAGPGCGCQIAAVLVFLALGFVVLMFFVWLLH